MRGRAVVAPDRDLRRLDGLAHAARSQPDAGEQQVRLRLVRRQIQRALQFEAASRSCVVGVQPSAAIEVKRRQIPLVAQFCGVDTGSGRSAGPADRGRHSPARGPSGRRRRLPPAASRPPHTRKTAGAPARARVRPAAASPADFSADAQHEVGVGVARLPPDGLPQPVDRGRRVALQRVRIPEVERIVRRPGVFVGRAREEIRGRARLGRSAAAQLHDAQVVEDGRRRRLVGERPQRREGLVIPLELRSETEPPGTGPGERAATDRARPRPPPRPARLPLAPSAIATARRGRVVRRIQPHCRLQELRPAMTACWRAAP